MTDRETSVLLDELAGQVPVGPAPTTRLLRAGRRARRRRAAGVTLAVAAGAAVLVGGAVTVLDRDPGGGEPASLVVAEEAAPDSPESAGEDPAGSAVAEVPQNPAAGRTGPLDGGAAHSCVQEYSPEAVRGAGFAFDGVVTAIGPSVTDRSDSSDLDLAGVTFAVREWFSGGSGGTVTVDLPAPAVGQGTSTGPDPEYGIGSRLLVSGADRWDDDESVDLIGWPCGFTRYYDEATAVSWR